MAQMQLPTVDDVNATRLARFAEAITEALGSTQIGFFRDLVGHYVHEPRRPRGRRRRRARDRRSRRRSRCCGSSRSRERPSGEHATAATGATATAVAPTADRAAVNDSPGDVQDRRRQAAPGRAAPDRRRARQRGRAAVARTSAGSHPSGLLHRRAAGQAAGAGLGEAQGDPDQRQADRAPARLRPAQQGRQEEAAGLGLVTVAAQPPRPPEVEEVAPATVTSPLGECRRAAVGRQRRRAGRAGRSPRSCRRRSWRPAASRPLHRRPAPRCRST